MSADSSPAAPSQGPSERPQRVMFVTTAMDVGGEEMLLLQLIRRLDRTRFAPELCCLKHFGDLGELLARELPATTGLLAHKFDVAVLGRLTRLMRERQIDAVVTVGTGGDKMFWGRLAAWRAGVPIIVSAIHSTGWPIRVEWLNRRLAFLTDAFVAVARGHGQHIIDHEGCPAKKVWVIPNGVDTDRFRPREPQSALRAEIGLPSGVPVAGTIAVLRPEKNHALWLKAAARIRQQVPSAHFLIVGDGPQRANLEQLAASLGLAEVVHFCGRRYDTPELLSLMDVFVLSSDMEASPVSILEALAAGKPVVSTRVGSIPESVIEGVTGYLVSPGDEQGIAQRVSQLLGQPDHARQLGQAGREHVVANSSVERMVAGYQEMLQRLARVKRGLEGPVAETQAPAQLGQLLPADSSAK
jgi:glycosyltransferase involved in cell wall biosynthesis